MPACADYVPIWKLNELIGKDAAKVMLSVYGGSKVRIPASADPGSQLTGVIGIEAAIKLSSYFASRGANDRLCGATIELPSGKSCSRNPQQLRLIEMIEAGATDREILDELDVVDRTIRRWRASLGRSKRTPQGPAHPRMEAMVRDLSRSVQSIADELGVSVSAVTRWRVFFVPKAERDASSMRRIPIRPEAIGLLASGLPVRMIAKQLGVAQGTVYRWKQRLHEQAGSASRRPA